MTTGGTTDQKEIHPFPQRTKDVARSKNLKLQYANWKLALKCQGPFQIIKVLGPLTYKLKLPISWKIHLVFHANLLTPYHKNDTHGPNYTEPPPDLISRGRIQDRGNHQPQTLLEYEKVPYLLKGV